MDFIKKVLSKKYMQKDKKFYDDFFSKYPVNVHDSPDRFKAVSALLSGDVLDVACGTGTLADYYFGKYTGVDISDVAIKKAYAVRRAGAKFLTFDFTKVKITESAAFDSVYLGEFLEHIENDDVVFKNIVQLLKPNGKIVVTVPNSDRVPDESHCRIFTVRQIRREYSKYGKIVFHNWSGFRNRILFTIEPGQTQKEEVCLVMIVKDEAKGLERAILSALPIVQRVVVSIDTMTTDETVEIAILYADELRFHVWEGDFSKARNSAQENVKTKWILFLDGHEYLESFGDIEEKLKDDVDGIFVTVRMESGMTFLYPRFYRNFIKFKNAVHNVNECKTRRCAPLCVIVHDRVNGQDEKSTERRNEQREKMMPAELANQLKTNPKNGRAHFHLANFYMMRHETKKAMKHYKAVVKFGISPDEKYMALLHFGALHASLGHYFRALLAFEKADKLIPGRWESSRTIGGLYFMTHRFKKALPWLVQALTPNSRRYAYQPMEQKMYEIWDMIGNCFAKLDQNPQAVTAWERACELSSSDTQKKFFGEKIKLVKMLLRP